MFIPTFPKQFIDREGEAPAEPWRRQLGRSLALPNDDPKVAFSPAFFLFRPIGTLFVFNLTGIRNCGSSASQYGNRMRFGSNKMFSTVKVFFNKCRSVLAAMGFLFILAPQSFAGVWSSALGDARSVQHKTEDIAERLNKDFPYSQVTVIALHLDNAACQMVESIKCGASWEQVQSILSRTCGLAGQVNELANLDCNVRNDRRIRDYVNDLSKRAERLHCSLDKAYAKTQPKFCTPPVVSHRPFATAPSAGWNSSFQLRVVPSEPSHYPYRSMPNQDPRFNAQPDYPRDTYEFDSPRYDAQPPQFEAAPEAIPSGRPIGPIEYRVERNVPSQNPRAAALVQLGLHAIQVIAQNR